MKEEGKDHVVTGFKKPVDGWHPVTFQQGIDFLPGKGGEGVYQNERGFKTYKFPALVTEPEAESDGADVSQLCGVEKGGGWLANILACVGLWEAVKKRFPDPGVSVFDAPVIEGIKGKLPGLSCMMRTEIDKDGNARVREMASFAKYKEIQAEAKAKAGKDAKKGKAETAAPAAAAEEEKKDEWV